MNPNLTRIRSAWRRLLVSLYLSWVVFLNQFYSRRAFVHWIGHKRPRRRERLLIFLLLFVAMFVLEPIEYALWAAIWGGLFSISINLYIGYWLLHRRRYHWL